MKIKWINIIISIGIAFLLSYGVYVLNNPNKEVEENQNTQKIEEINTDSVQEEENTFELERKYQTIISSYSLILLSLSLFGIIGIKFEDPKKNQGIKAISFIFLPIFVALIVTFSFIKVYYPAFFITNGIILLTYIAIVSAILGNKKVAKK